MNELIYIFVTPFFPSPENWRGAYCYDMVRALQQEFKNRGDNIEVKVFVPRRGSDYDYQGVHVYRFPVVELPFGLFPFLFDYYNTRSFLNKLKEVITPLSISASSHNIFSHVKICHVHTSEFAIYALALKRLNPSCKTLLHHHNCEPVRLNAGRLGNIRGYTDLVYHWQRKNCDQIDLHVFCSKRARETYGLYAPNGPEAAWRDIREKCLFGKLHRPLSAHRSIILYNGVDTSIFSPLSRPRPSTSTSFVIGCIGNFQPLKGHMILLQAIDKIKGKIPNLRVRLVGSGETLPACKKFVEEMGLTDILSFETEVDHTQLPAFYHSLDLFVLPSRLEGFCCVYMEAAACGVPYIGCKGISCAEVISPQACDIWLAEPDNVDSLADKIVQYYQSHPVQRLTRSMSWSDLIREFIDAFNLTTAENG